MVVLGGNNGIYNFKKTAMLIINLGLLITFILSLIFGLLSSEDLLKFLNIGNLKIIKLHKILAYISLIFMDLHLGINFNATFSKISNKIKNKILIYLIDLIVIVIGIYSFISLDIIKHITGEFGFSVLRGNIAINILKYLSIIMMLAIIINKIYNYKRGGK